ncbi:hypothetical protein N7468_006083 [Penicillium chermesinum]|uniref:Uncharacterized protein n=1 Tax=Penicillium chermesinum TaxID=63820 RepID=A0A9W9P2T9_9EURO|nr:uncharacterized protein N7468_006083 [Penicillium chermesinum]KAJ5233127.1 hypothetical protein N7468_006083 [Penicillium chermesinum]
MASQGYYGNQPPQAHYGPPQPGYGPPPGQEGYYGQPQYAPQPGYYQGPQYAPPVQQAPQTKGNNGGFGDGCLGTW